MIEHFQEAKEETEKPAPGPEELASAGDVIHSMVRTSKGLRIYLANNPVLIKFVDELAARMAQHISRFGDFRLEVERFALKYRGADLYRNEDPKESIAFRLFADGVRALVFTSGIEPEELTAFLDIVGFERPSPQDDDIVTQLWERNLPHVDYLLEEDFLEVGWPHEGDGGGVSQQEAISRIYAFVEQSSPLPPRVVSKHLLMLTGAEAEWLRLAQQAEEQRNPLDDVINILSAILSGSSDAGLFDDFAKIMAQLAVDMFLAGEVGLVLRLVRFLSQLAALDSVAEEQRSLVRERLTGILSERTVELLQKAIDSTDTVGPDQLRELLLVFGLPCLGAICELLGRVEKLKMRKVIVEVLVELGKADPKVFAPFLSDPRWYLVRNVVLVLSLIGSPAALEMILGLVSHREMRIRKEVLGFLERSPDARARSYIVRYLRDEAAPLRTRALQILARERLGAALKPVVALAAAEDFRTRELAEKKAVYETIAVLGGESTLPLFRELLLRRSWFKMAADRDSAICAVAGLVRMGGAAALGLLEEARGQRNVEVRGIVEQGIAALASARGKGGAGPEEA